MKESTLNAKKAVVAEIVDRVSRAQSIVLYDYRGLTVAEVSDLRNKMRAAGIDYKVLKNTMLKRAFDEQGITGADEYLNGPTAAIFSYDDPGAGARILLDFVKAVKKTEVKAAVVGSKAVGPEGVKMLSEMPTKEQLLAKMLGSLNMPITGFVTVLAGILKKPLYALNAIKDQKAGN